MALDLQQLQLLNDQQKAAYMHSEKMFASEFWPWIKQWAEANAAEQRERVVNAATWDFNRVATGARYAFELLANLEKVTEAEFANVAEAAAEAKESEVEQDNE